MSYSRSIYLLLAFYFLILLVLAPTNLLSLDTYYYWDWSRHLALSYYDGSPMIAYFIRLATLILGDNLFALTSVGITVAALTSLIIYKTARFFLTPKASFIALCSWLFAPLVTMDILKQTTYDTPLTLFWALTLYYCVKFIKTNSLKELYFIGASVGLMLLSKYTGIVLLLAVILFLISTEYRALFKTKQFYLAILVTALIFSPVLFWNYQHEWQSFIYQLTAHGLKDLSHPLTHMLSALCTVFIPSLNIMLIPPFLPQNAVLEEKKALILKLCCIVCLTFLCFFLYASSKTALREFWLSPYLISASLLFAYWIDKFQYHKLAIGLITLYALISLAILIDNTYKYNFIPAKKFAFYHLIQQFNATYPKQHPILFTSGWFQARMLFFLDKKPQIYTLDCGMEQNQYALWNAEVNKQIAEKTLKKLLFIDKYDRLNCLKKYFEVCKKVPTNTYPFKNKEYTLNVYECRNS